MVLFFEVAPPALNPPPFPSPDSLLDIVEFFKIALPLVENPPPSNSE